MILGSLWLMLLCAGCQGGQEEAAAEDVAYQAIWQEETITLRAGLNVFYLTEANCVSRMILSVAGLEPADVLYADIKPER